MKLTRTAKSGGGRTIVTELADHGLGQSASKHVPTLKAGRVCEHPGCRTKLNHFHAGNLCYLHQRPRYSRRGRK